jgi:hypothetical protein
VNGQQLREALDAAYKAACTSDPNDELSARLAVDRIRRQLDSGALVPLDAETADRIEAAEKTLPGCCREEDCRKPAEFVLWGKLLPAEALGPRCYDHAAKHVGHRALGDPSWAIVDLRPLHRALADLRRARGGA